MIKRIKSLLSIDRNKAIVYSFSASFIARVVGLLSTLIITPLLINYFSDEQYGLWSILIILVGFVGFADLGLGYGLMNLLSEAKHKQSKIYQDKAITTTFLFLSLTSLLLMAIMVLINYFIDWRELFNISTLSLGNEMSYSMFLVIVLFFINIPVTIIHKIQFAWLDNHIYHFWEIFQKLLVIVLTFICVYTEKPLSFFVLAFYTPYILSNVLNIVFYLRTRTLIKNLQTKNIRKYIDRDVFKIVFKMGFMFLLMSLTYHIGRSSDNFIIGKFSSLETVTAYEVIKKPLDIILVFIMMLSSILWPAFGDAIYAKDFKWINKVFRKSLIGVVLFSVITIGCMLPFENQILELWLGKSYDFSLILFGLAGVWYFLLSINNVLSSFLSANTILKEQVYMFLSYIILGIPLKIIGVIQFELKALFLLNSVAFIITILIPSFIISYRRLRTFKTGVQI